MKIIVAGIGNLLMGDDGLGVHAIRAMKENPVEPGIILVDVGTSSLSLAVDLEQADGLLLLDAVRTGARPGTLHQLAADAVARPRMPRSLHEYGVGHVLAHMDVVRRPRKVMILGLEPFRVEFGMTLSEPVTGALPELVEAAWHMARQWSVDLPYDPGAPHAAKPLEITP